MPRFLLALTSFLLFPLSSFAFSWQGGEDTLTAGDRVFWEEEVTGDAIGLGAAVNQEQAVGADGSYLGGEVFVGASTGDDLHAVGGSVTLAGLVEDNAMLAGGKVTLLTSSEIKGDMLVVAETLVLRGQIGGTLTFRGQELIVDGPVAGDLIVDAKRVTFTDQASFAQAILAVESTEGLEYVDETLLHYETRTEMAHRIPVPSLSLMRWGFVLAFFLSSAPFLFFFLHQQTTKKKKTPLFVFEVQRFFIHLGTGIVALFFLPILSVLLSISVVLMPIGMFLLFLYVALLFLAFLLLPFFLLQHCCGPKLFQNALLLLGGFCAMHLLLFLLSLLPYVGGVLFFLLFLVSLGALLHFFWTLYATHRH